MPALRLRGSLKAGMPFEIASTPVSAVVPLENACSSRNSVTAADVRALVQRRRVDHGAERAQELADERGADRQVHDRDEEEGRHRERRLPDSRTPRRLISITRPTSTTAIADPVREQRGERRDELRDARRHRHGDRQDVVHQQRRARHLGRRARPGCRAPRCRRRRRPGRRGSSARTRTSRAPAAPRSRSRSGTPARRRRCPRTPGSSASPGSRRPSTTARPRRRRRGRPSCRSPRWGASAVGRGRPSSHSRHEERRLALDSRSSGCGAAAGAYERGVFHG